jgi:hypothetical protein
MPARPVRRADTVTTRRLITFAAGGPPTLAFVVHVVTLVGALGALLQLGRPLWFFGDEWEFLVNRGGFHRPHLGLWDPHAHTHWSTGPILIYKALFAVFGVRHYAPYLLLVLLTHIVTAYLLWRVMRRVGVLPWVATGLAAVFCVLGGGEENILWAFQITMNGSMLLGLVHLLLVDRDGKYGPRDIAALITGLVALTFSGITVTMIAVSTLVVLLRRGWRLAALTGGPPALAYLIWYVVIARNDVSPSPPAAGSRLAQVKALARFLWTGLSHVGDAATGLTGVGGVLLLGLLFWLGWRLLQHRAALGRRPADTDGPAGSGSVNGMWPDRWAAVAMAAGAILLFVIVSVGRVNYGLEGAKASRYVYLVGALLLPAIGLLLSELGTGSAARGVVVAVLIAYLGVHGFAELLTERHARLGREVPARGQILAAANLLASGALTVQEPVEDIWNPDLLASDVQKLRSAGDLPTGYALTDADRLRAAAALQVAFRPAPILPQTGGAREVAVEAATAATASGGCVTVAPLGPDPRVVVEWVRPGSLQVVSPSGGRVSAVLLEQGGVTSQPRPGTVMPGEPLGLDVSHLGPMVVTLPASSPSRLCGLSN